MRSAIRHLLAWTSLSLMLVLAGSASAAHTAFPPGSPFSSGTDVIAGFQTCFTGTIGPVGLLNDGVHFLADDLCNTTTYRFPTGGGGVLSPQASAVNGLTHGITLSGGVYYGISDGGDSFLPAGVYRLDPNTLAVTGPIVTSFPGITGGPFGITSDPLTGDLYVSSGGGGIDRIQDPSGSPIVSTFVCCDFYDGLVFKADVSVLYAARPSDQHVLGFDRTAAVVMDVNDSPHGPDGVAVAEPNTFVSTTNGTLDVSNNVFVNSNDGTIERIDVNNGNVLTVAADGGSRGDFATVGPDRCLYVTQSATIEKLTPCFFQLVGAGAQATGLTLTPAAAADPMGTQHTVTATATDSSGHPAALVTIRFNASGANSANGSQGTDANGKATFTYTGPNAGADTISAYADNNGNKVADAGEPTATASKVWFTPLAGGGSFVIGDGNSANGSHVTFWSKDWSKVNSLSGGSAPTSFFGFASHTPTKPPKCGDSWTTEQGVKSNPPFSVPAYMAVIASSSIGKSGATIFGNSPKVVVVKTDPGYAPDAKHSGMGTVVGQVC